MQNAAVPMLAIQTDIRALIEINGNFIGVSAPGEHVAMPVSASGDYFISATPLGETEQTRRYAITRRISFENGNLLPVAAADVSLCKWPGSLYEIDLTPGTWNPETAPFPYTIAKLHLQGQPSRNAILYEDNGLRLAFEENGNIRTGYALGRVQNGKLFLLTCGTDTLLAAQCETENKQRLLLFRQDFTPLLDISGHQILTENNIPATITKLQTNLGHEQKTAYLYQRGTFLRQETETGFFTHPYQKPETPLRVAIAFSEAIREGFFQEARTYLTSQLADGLDLAQVRDFLGPFSCCRPPLSDKSGRLIGFIFQERDRLSYAKLIAFEFDGLLIDNVSEA